MLVKLNDYWEKIKGFAIIANGLDPRFKIDIMTRNDKEFFTEKLTEIFNSGNLCSPSSSPELSKEKVKLTITEQIMLKRKLVSNSTDEIENYLSSPRLNSLKSEPLNWWRENKETYPFLSAVAMDYLSCVPSSTASERSFSISGQFITDDR